MASRITIYGSPSNTDIKRLRREMNVMLLDYDLVDPAQDQRGLPQLPDWTPDSAQTPMVEVRRSDDQGSVYLKNPDEPTLRQCLYSEGNSLRDGVLGMTALTPDTCKLCRFVDGKRRDGDIMPTFIGRDDHWDMVLNEDQATLGRIYLVCRRHETDVTRLTASEQSGLWALTRAVTVALNGLYAPDHYNYVFLMNLVRHCHFHIYPRYELPRRFGGVEFVDDAFGGHYDPAGTHILDADVQSALAEAIRVELHETPAAPGAELMKDLTCSHI